MQYKYFIYGSYKFFLVFLHHLLWHKKVSFVLSEYLPGKIFKLKIRLHFLYLIWNTMMYFFILFIIIFYTLFGIQWCIFFFIESRLKDIVLYKKINIHMYFTVVLYSFAVWFTTKKISLVILLNKNWETI